MLHAFGSRPLIDTILDQWQGAQRANFRASERVMRGRNSVEIFKTFRPTTQ